MPHEEFQKNLPYQGTSHPEEAPRDSHRAMYFVCGKPPTKTDGKKYNMAKVANIMVYPTLKSRKLIYPKPPSGFG